MGVNTFDQLIAACHESEVWPSNLIRKKHLERVQRHYQKQLEGYEERLFVTSGASVEFWEARVGMDRKTSKTRNGIVLSSANTMPQGFTEKVVEDPKGLVQHYAHHLQLREKDPRSRHMSVS